MKTVAKSNVWKLILRSYDAKIFDSVVSRIFEIAKTTMVNVSAVMMPNKKKLFCLLRSCFIYKTSRDQIHFIQRKRVLFFHLNPAQTMDIFKDCKIPSGVELEIIAPK